MGYHSSPLVGFIMTLFNVRLGWWLGNPGTPGAATWRRSGPHYAVGPLFSEAVGNTTDSYKYVNLSDGGHFDNLGLYEMVLRRCRFILAVDAGQDFNYVFEDLGNAIRKIRIDLGIPIDIKVVSPRKAEGAIPRCAFGTIGYSAVDGTTSDGSLIYIKPTIFGDEPPDVTNYAAAHPEFPHEATTDQWFSESQLESYRLLGLHAIASICGEDWATPRRATLLRPGERRVGREQKPEPLEHPIFASRWPLRNFVSFLLARLRGTRLKKVYETARAGTRFGGALRIASIATCALALLSLLVAGCTRKTPEDEAKLAGLSPDDFPQITADIFKPMDGGIALAPNEIMGRNTWNLWSGGNQHFWNHVAQDSFGLMDLLKMLDNRKYPRGERFKTLGLVNEPGFRAASKPDEYGLWLDEQVEPEPAGIDYKIYGKPSGVLGFRLFPNPEFNDEARKKWDGARFINDPHYYSTNQLVRPYRVGVACGACHISPNPSNPPADPENPRWENLASAIGNQYIREGKVFAPNVEKGGFFYEELAAQPPGTSDTSRIATDHINNPNAINAIFLLAERERIAADRKNGRRDARFAGREGGNGRPPHPEGWSGFDRRPRRDNPGLRQHRDVFRILAHPA